MLQAYVVGERGIMDELSSVGITSFGGPDDNGKVASFDRETQQDPTVGAVVCGVDPGLSYYKVCAPRRV
jgi:ribonucleotide monophosphatase NagD (HAD superfamily)